MSLPKPLESLIEELGKFPGIGRRSAERMAFDLVAARPERVEALMAALEAMRSDMGVCEECGYFTSEGRCLICTGNRQGDSVLVVEKPLDVVALEKSAGFRGLYHVLGGHLSPLKGVGPEDLRLDQLFRRLKEPEVRELILATSSTVEGDATALYIIKHIARNDLKITRLGRGVPMGGALEFADSGTLRLALEGRRSVER